VGGKPILEIIYLAIKQRNHYNDLMTDISNALIYEVLKSIQGSVADIRSTLQDHARLLHRIREDINAMRGDDLRLEAMQAAMDNRLERIERRLDLADA